MDNTKPPTARKTHRKTRTGCRTCKQRKIKCDEQRPSCSNCIRHSVQCDYLSAQGIAQGGGSGGSTHGNTPQSSSNVDTPMGSSYDRVSVTNLVDPLPGINLLDLELLHNYITSTAATLHTDPIIKTVWRLNVTQLGFTYEYVMRSILALSALHLAFYRRERREFYIAQAMLQHESGLRMITSVLQNVTDENCTAVYVFSALTLFFTLGSPRGPSGFLIVGDNGIADWCKLVKGTGYIIEASSETLATGAVGPMFIAGRRRSQMRNEALATQSIQDHPLTHLSSLISQTCQSQPQASIYQSAITCLRDSFVFYYQPGPAGYETADIFAWVFDISDEYLNLLREHTQESLAIFGYFCVVLKKLDGCWWMQGWSEHLISRIWALLDEEHRLWIRWPIEEIGWVPT